LLHKQEFDSRQGRSRTGNKVIIGSEKFRSPSLITNHMLKTNAKMPVIKKLHLDRNTELLWVKGFYW